MKTVTKLITLCALTLSLFVNINTSAATFTFTAIPDEDESQLRTRFEKVALYLEQKLGVKVEYVPVKSYSAAVTAFRNNQVQLAWFGGLSGVQARRLVPDSQAIAQGYEDQFFKSYFIAHYSTGLERSESFPAISQKTFTFGSKGSTSGRLMPQYYIEKHLEKKPQQAFKRVGFSGDHSRTIAQVQAGAYEIGAVNYKVWETALVSGKIDSNKVSVIWETPAYPDYQWTIRAGVDAKFGKGFKDKVQAALLNMNNLELLKSFPRSSFVNATNKDFEPVLTVAKKIGLID
ncbi:MULTISPECIES: putative selenate ABC transporter substrate-binding protein [unclassified Colwellia]|uniref:putative selenate ABC transporter substrate-binding protein n=1 Tax=unclassified Colwellia TaxID=196834 RepID=UPI0015F64F03|nr:MULTISPECIES: putative selenate ABC transporter substrate-binding protein [unclassified Colwellia]MBA6233609.1 putative selenate ABC transporter substrate-binding protein [Colwellia sp. MB02u-7]MBA6238169.1 putative selenate ABC transporter substrate-binding protein [Colwellia sp. MB02u-11]MBA6255067.1 putative selenate ABC transporter substrate-binding protein [Colwellia sp. MB3u-28]MBA6258982.1 putative selenate ABC transporter substrate-binding protein [Colwellia sp. MB3u-41]MBA6299694.1